MSALKDLVDLVTQLDNSIRDRKCRELLHPVKDKTHAVQSEQLKLQSELFEGKAKHRELQSEHRDLVSKYGELQSRHLDVVAENKTLMERIEALEMRIASFEAMQSNATREFSAQTGTYLDPESGLHHCPVCACPMKDDGHGWECRCGKKFLDPNRKKERLSMQQMADRAKRKRGQP